jgi:hypothetical protein
MASTAIRERRRTLRYRNLLVRQMLQMKIKISALLMEAGVSYNKQRLHKAGYFRALLASNPDIDEGLLLMGQRVGTETAPHLPAAHSFVWCRNHHALTGTQTSPSGIGLVVAEGFHGIDRGGAAGRNE